MQQFDDTKGKRRLLTISNMKEAEAEMFYDQFPKVPQEVKEECTAELKKQIRRTQENHFPLEWILAVYSREGKLVGKLEVSSIQDQKASLIIEVPNQDWVVKYGIEAIDQFLKISRENDYFKQIELVPSIVTEQYRKVHSMENYITS